MYKKISVMLVLCMSALCQAQVQEPKVYSAQERKIEEARIAKEIEENLDWHNLAPDQLDGVADSERRLYARRNQSILLSRATRERFGTFEAFNDKNQKVNEIRFHKRNILTHRFLTDDFECQPALFAVKIAPEYILYEAGCTQRNANRKIKHETLIPYLFDRASQGIYWLGSFSFEDNPRYTITYKNKKYNYSAIYTVDGKKQIDKRTFSILKNPQGEWIVKEPAIDNDESGALNPVEALPKLPLDPKYNLPNVINWDE